MRRHHFGTEQCRDFARRAPQTARIAIIMPQHHEGCIFDSQPFELGEVVGIVNARNHFSPRRDGAVTFQNLENTAQSGFHGFIPEHGLSQRQKRRVWIARAQFAHGGDGFRVKRRRRQHKGKRALTRKPDAKHALQCNCNG